MAKITKTSGAQPPESYEVLSTQHFRAGNIDTFHLEIPYFVKSGAADCSRMLR